MAVLPMNGEPQKTPGQEIQPQGDEVSADQSVAPQIPEVVRDEVRRRLPGSVQHAVGFQVTTGPPPDAFLEKLQPEHITKVLDYTRQDKKDEHWRLIYYYGVGIIGFLLLCIVFLYAGKDAILKEIISAFIGFAGGFGVGKWTTKK